MIRYLILFLVCSCASSPPASRCIQCEDGETLQCAPAPLPDWGYPTPPKKGKKP